jgi:hypothetical protein
VGVKRSKLEADRSLPSRLEVNNMWSLTSMPFVFEYYCVLVWGSFTILHFLTQFYLNFKLNFTILGSTCHSMILNYTLLSTMAQEYRCVFQFGVKICILCDFWYCIGFDVHLLQIKICCHCI